MLVMFLRQSLLLDIAEDIYRQFYYFTIVASYLILDKAFFSLGLWKKIFLPKVCHSSFPKGSLVHSKPKNLPHWMIGTCIISTKGCMVSKPTHWCHWGTSPLGGSTCSEQPNTASWTHYFWNWNFYFIFLNSNNNLFIKAIHFPFKW